MGNNKKIGLLYGLLAYAMWGSLAIYWKQLQHVPASEVLADRIVWAEIFIFLLIALTRKTAVLLREAKEVFASPPLLLRVMTAGFMMAVNWGIYIWAVEENRILETSMGSFINPLVNVLCGMLFLGERLSCLQAAAVLLATVGIGFMVVASGSIPWVSVGMAVSFALYGLMKKKIFLKPMNSVLLETAFTLPFALGYLWYLGAHGGNAYQSGDVTTLLYIAGAGVVTATPLMIFAASARLLSLTTLGFLQYISPSISLLVGVFLYNEAFTSTHAWSFGFIWAGLALFTWSSLKAK